MKIEKQYQYNVGHGGKRRVSRKGNVERQKSTASRVWFKSCLAVTIPGCFLMVTSLLGLWVDNI